MTATFGDFVRPAGQHIAAAAAFRSDLTDDVRCVAVRELGRLVCALARYFDDLPPTGDPAPAGHRPPSPGTQAAADARIALRRAARSLRHATPIADDAHPVVRHLSAAADYLAAGRDLLQTHFTTAPSGAHTGSSHWAPIVTSGPVTAALLSELAEHARTLAPWAAQLTMTGPLGSGMPAPERLILHSAIGGLWITGAAVEAAQRDHPPPEDARRLLAAVPASVPPPRRPPGNQEPVTQLCDGITVTAERLRHAALGSARRSRATTSPSWRRGALASAITSHASEIILRTLAERASQLGIDPAVRVQLHEAADTVSVAWPVWRAVACEWDILSTGVHAGSVCTAADADFGDLALRIGRLAYDSPHWTPACASTSPIRAPADLAATPDGVSVMLAAVHHAADAISRVAAADQQAVRTAAGEDRLYLPTRLMPESYDIPYRYTLAPRWHTDTLLVAYATAVSASARVTQVLDDVADAINAPSTMLGASRNFERLQTDARRREGHGLAHDEAPSTMPPTTPWHATQVECLLHSLQITDPAMLLRAVAIDQASYDLVAQAAAKAIKRDSIAGPTQRRPQIAPNRPASIASKDFPCGVPERNQQVPYAGMRAATMPSTGTAANRSAMSRADGISRSA